MGRDVGPARAAGGFRVDAGLVAALWLTVLVPACHHPRAEMMLERHADRRQAMVQIWARQERRSAEDLAALAKAIEQNRADRPANREKTFSTIRTLESRRRDRLLHPEWGWARRATLLLEGRPDRIPETWVKMFD